MVWTWFPVVMSGLGLGLEAPAWAWPCEAWACTKSRPGPKPAKPWAKPKPWLEPGIIAAKCLSEENCKCSVATVRDGSCHMDTTSTNVSAI